MSTSLLTLSWENSQTWNIYVAFGKTLEQIRKDWIAKNKEGAKGYSDINADHRTDFSERCQENMNKIMEKFRSFQSSKMQTFEMQILNYSMHQLLYILLFLKKN